MRKINKNQEPNSLTQFKRRSPNTTYADLSAGLRQDIRQACTTEQHYLCAYCCKEITGSNKDTLNEHLIPQHLAANRSLDFDNLVASCTTKGQCDSAHDNKPLPLTPLMQECETEFVFKLSGRVKGITERARESIQVLNLGDCEQHNKALIEKRKQLVSALLFSNGIDPVAPVEDDELLQMLIDDLSQPINGKLQAYAPVVVNILRNWIA